jgi:MFS family permease
MLSRFSQGIGSALSATLVYSTAASLCDESNLKITMGYMELAYSVGLTIGPLVASFLFYLRGYNFPFYVCSFLILLCIPFISKLEINEEEYEEPDFFGIIKNIVKFN